VRKKYYTTHHNDQWTFFDYDENGNMVYLMKMGKVAIKRHTKIRSAANPYDPKDETYFEQRIQQQLLQKQQGKRLFRQIYNRQKGRCPKCKQLINNTSGWNIHHITPVHLGGKTMMDNLVMLHPVCHQQIHYAPKFS
jgi:RNA-directed DNA polymerase